MYFSKAHKDACQRNEEGYLDPKTQLFVLTSVFLKKREKCCGSGCRHCPYSENEKKEANRPLGPSFPLSEKEF